MKIIHNMCLTTSHSLIVLLIVNPLSIISNFFSPLLTFHLLLARFTQSVQSAGESDENFRCENASISNAINRNNSLFTTQAVLMNLVVNRPDLRLAAHN